MTFMPLKKELAAPLTLVSLIFGVPASPAYHSEYWLLLAVLVSLTSLLSDFVRWRLLARLYRVLGCIDGED